MEKKKMNYWLILTFICAFGLAFVTNEPYALIALILFFFLLYKTWSWGIEND